MTPDDETAEYFGAAAGEDDASYALPPADDDPYGAPADDPYGASDDDPYGAAEDDVYADSAADEEPEYALPAASGDANDEPEYSLPAASESDEPEYSLPAATESEPEYSLPPQQDDSADYSASDFMANDGAVAEDPETYDDPYETQNAYDEYGDYEAGTEDDGYYDSLAHDDGLETGMATQTEAGYDTEEFADDDQPKTISQQDAESIIRRITTKRILPPEQQQAGDLRPQTLTPSGGGLKIWPILFLLLVIGGAVAFAFKDQILGEQGGTTIVQETPKPSISAEELARRELVKRILTSEAKAFDRQPAELINAASKTGAPGMDSKTGVAKTGATPPGPAKTDQAKTEEGGK